MKHRKMCAFLLLFLALAVGLFACAIVRPYPEDGRWYCEELGMVLDFSSSPHMAELASDGEVVKTPFHIDYGNTIFVDDPDGGEDILRGEYRLRDDVFTVNTFEGETYTFVYMQPPG